MQLRIQCLRARMIRIHTYHHIAYSATRLLRRQTRTRHTYAMWTRTLICRNIAIRRRHSLGRETLDDDGNNRRAKRARGADTLGIVSYNENSGLHIYEDEGEDETSRVGREERIGQNTRHDNSELRSKRTGIQTEQNMTRQNRTVSFLPSAHITVGELLRALTHRSSTPGASNGGAERRRPIPRRWRTRITYPIHQLHTVLQDKSSAKTRVQSKRD
ncbi:hypothetical protein C8Q73DRAFT_411733 [Cubamyces lactineus]|nr:hypothetical protein C8Q73DRAFT_411733 [Cubamyces lactineus]